MIQRDDVLDQLAALEKERQAVRERFLEDTARMEGAERLCRHWLAKIDAREKEAREVAETEAADLRRNGHVEAAHAAADCGGGGYSPD